MNAHRRERGQSLVIIVLAMVALMGFAALALDVGRVFAERRRAQNAADSAAYAAAIAASLEDDWTGAAMAQVALNDFNDSDPGENLDLKYDVQVYHPPVMGPYSDPNVEDYEEYYQVVIHAWVDSIFSQFIFTGPLQFTVEAVSRSEPVKALFNGDAMVATNHSACKALWFQGDGATYINGGNIYSNSDRSGTPASCYAGVQNGSGLISVVGGGITSVGGFLYNNGSVTAEYGVSQVDHSQDLEPLPNPDCSGLDEQTYAPLAPGTPGPNVIHPGHYARGIKINAGEQVFMESGMYCLEDNFTSNGGTVMDIVNSNTGTMGVFIVMLRGDFLIGGNTVVHLNRLDSYFDASGNAWHGMLLFMPYRDPWFNDGEVRIGGGGTSSYSGTIYAPGPAHDGYKCTIEGNGESVGLSSNVICDTIFVTGTADIQIHYKAESNYRFAPKIELSQ